MRVKVVILALERRKDSRRFSANVHLFYPAQADTSTARVEDKNAQIRSLPEIRQSYDDYDKNQGPSRGKLGVCRCRTSLPLLAG
jgi:hypothetical protein